jgi:hypothetical protein
VFVSGWRTTPDDPWAHRKAEPRVFALCWAAYLMLGALLTLFASRPTGHFAFTHYEYGARALFMITAIGAVVLAPMIRLSQLRPRKPVRDLAMDFFIITFPANTLIWPFPLLTRWPFATAGALALLITSWTALSFAFVALCLSRERCPRSSAMLAIIACAGCAPAAVLFSKLVLHIEPHTLLPMLSPFTGAYELTLTPEGVTPRVSPAQLLLAAAPFLPAGILLAGAARGKRTARPDRLQ